MLVALAWALIEDGKSSEVLALRLQLLQTSFQALLGSFDAHCLLGVQLLSGRRIVLDSWGHTGHCCCDIPCQPADL